MSYSFGPLEAARKAPSLARFSSPSPANGGITVFPNWAGLATYWAKYSALRPLAPMSERSGAPRFEEPEPR